MEKNMENEKGYCSSCNGNAMNCRCWGMHHHSLLRILIALVILGFVFVAGMKLGELKAEVAMVYGGGYNNQSMTMHRGEGIMRPVGAYDITTGQAGDTTTTVVSPAVPVHPTTGPITQ